MTEYVPTIAGVIRLWRARTDPESVGFVSGSRRTAGLRREELAALAGISVDYVVRLEQGRALHPSAHVVASLCRALRLAGEEAALLHRLAGLASPEHAVTDVVPPSVERLLTRFDGLPVAVYSAHWWLLRWNAWYVALLGDPAERRGNDLNVVWREFADAGSRVVKTDEERAVFRGALVADLRLAALRCPRDRDLAGLIDELHAVSADFTRLWETAPVTEHRSARKRIIHPDVGAIVVDCDVLIAPGCDVRIVAYSAPPGTDDAHKLDLLASAAVTHHPMALHTGNGTHVLNTA